VSHTEGVARSRRLGSRRIAAIALIAIAAHVVVLAVVDALAVDLWGEAVPAVSLAASDPARPTPDSTAAAPVDVSVVALIDPAHTPPPMAVWGPGDLAGWANTHPFPEASIDRPGDTAAEAGGGATGGATIWAGRRDRLDDATLLAEPWNGGTDYRAAHDRRDDSQSSTEAIHRDPTLAPGDRATAPVARAGGDVASHGASAGIGAGDGDALWRDADPRFGLKPGQDQAVRTDGATQRTRDPAYVETGARSADVTTRGDHTADDQAVAAASKETNPDVYDLTPAQSGGTDRGVAGADGDGPTTDGTGDGEGATRAHAATGDRDLSVKATAQDPYFRAVLTRLGKEVQFPRDLAVDLRSGRPIAAFVLAADGTVSDIRLHTTSGFRGFDAELLRAVRTLKDLGPVPDRLLDGRSRLRVLVPFEFKSPMLR